MARPANAKSADVPLRGGAWAALLILALIAGLAISAKNLREDRQNAAKLDVAKVSSQPLPKPPAESHEEMDPDKE